VHTLLTILIRRGAFRLGYQQVTVYLKLLGEEPPQPKLGICTDCFSDLSVVVRKKSDDKETCDKCKNKVEPSRHALLCELCEQKAQLSPRDRTMYRVS